MEGLTQKSQTKKRLVRLLTYYFRMSQHGKVRLSETNSTFNVFRRTGKPTNPRGVRSSTVVYKLTSLDEPVGAVEREDPSLYSVVAHGTS